jgi:hypothetical protein
VQLCWAELNVGNSVTEWGFISVPLRLLPKFQLRCASSALLLWKGSNRGVSVSKSILAFAHTLFCIFTRRSLVMIHWLPFRSPYNDVAHAHSFYLHYLMAGFFFLAAKYGGRTCGWWLVANTPTTGSPSVCSQKKEPCLVDVRFLILSSLVQTWLIFLQLVIVGNLFTHTHPHGASMVK